MKIEELQKSFIPTEITLKLVRDIPKENYSEKLEILDNYINEVKDSFDIEVLLIKSNQEKGFIYWDAGKYHLAIKHYEKVLDVLAPSHYPFLYFHIAGTLISCYREEKQYEQSLRWAETALNNLEVVDSAFGEKLSILREYTALLNEAGIPFNEKYTATINCITHEMEFPPVSAVEPLERIKIISQEHKKWNHRLSKVHQIGRDNKEELITALKEYVASCEIGWYRKHAAQTLEKIENAS